MNWKMKALLFTFILSLVLNVISGLTSQTFWIYAVIGSYAVFSIQVAGIILEPIFDAFRHNLKIGGKQRLFFFCCFASVIVGAIMLLSQNIILVFASTN